MTNYFSNTVKGMALAGIVATLSACDTEGRLELAVRQSEGPVKIRLVQEVNIGNDKYILEVINAEGKRLAYMQTLGEPEMVRVRLSPDKTYNLNDRGVRVPSNR